MTAPRDMSGPLTAEMRERALERRLAEAIEGVGLAIGRALTRQPERSDPEQGSILIRVTPDWLAEIAAMQGCTVRVGPRLADGTHEPVFMRTTDDTVDR